MAKLDVTYAYAADIVKSERDPATGDLMVYGKATGPDLDLDGQICDPTWLKSAMPKWMEWGNVREMHQPIAAGVGVELTAEGDDWMLLSRCVDPSTAEKIEKGVLKGYSIGIKDAGVVKDSRAPGGRINRGGVVEVSYVDRPCNPTAKMSIAKSAGLALDGASIEVEDGADESLQPVTKDLEPPQVGDVEPNGDVVVAVIDAPELDAPVASTGAAGWSKAVGEDLVRRVRRLVPNLADLDKGATADVASAGDAIAIIANLIVSEATSLASGNAYEASQISCLLRSVDALQWFQCMESDEPTEGGSGGNELSASDLGGSITELAAGATITKSAGGLALPADTQVSDTVKAAVTEAMKAHEAELATLRAELAKMKALPIPGGPVLARTRAVIAEAEGREAALSKAAEFEIMANQLQATSPNVATEYRRQAAALRRE